jgi:hypothetical protein
MVAGSSNARRPVDTFCNWHSGRSVQGVTLTWGLMLRGKSIFGWTRAQRALAIFACAVLLYFAGGGSLLHHHTSGPETPCHICQSMHVPALAAAALKLVAAPELISRFSSLRQHAAPSQSFSLHRASRAPPSA